MRGLHLLVVCLALLSHAFADQDWWSLNQKLRTNLLKDYDKGTMPQRDFNGTTTVHFGMRIKRIWVEDSTQVLNVNAWMSLMWVDLRLHWDYKDNGNLNIVHFGDSELWKPDIHLYNNADVSEMDRYGNVHLLVYPDGTVLWVPPASLKVECPLDLTYWPFDIQTCHLNFGSWTSHGWQLNLELIGNNSLIETDMHDDTNPHWVLLSGTVMRFENYYPCCPEPYLTIIATIKVKRTSSSFQATIVIPAIVVSLLTLLQFLLPLKHPNRMTVGCVDALMTLMVLLYLAFTLPPMANASPLIVRFYGATLLVVTISMGVVAGVMRLADSHATYPPPSLLMTILTGPLATVLLIKQYSDQVGHSGGGGEDGEVLGEEKGLGVSGLAPSYSKQWLLVAAALDRIAVFTFILTYVITLFAFVCPLG